MNPQKRPPNSKPCKPIQLFPVIQRMMPFQMQRVDQKELRTFTSALAASLASNPVMYFQPDDAQALDAGYLMRNEYSLPIPLKANGVPRNIWILLCSQILGRTVADESLIAWHFNISKPLSSLPPDEVRRYDWDASIIESGLKLGILRENLVRIAQACQDYKVANAKPEEVEVLREVSLSADGQELARQEINAYAANVEASIARSSRAFNNAFQAEPTGREISHKWMER